MSDFDYDQGDPSDHWNPGPVMSQKDHDDHEARVLGAEKPEAAWILTDRDVWHKNPYYHGPAVPHPEDDAAWEAQFATKLSDAQLEREMRAFE